MPLKQELAPLREFRVRWIVFVGNSSQQEGIWLTADNKQHGFVAKRSLRHH
jgi:hypothetical protein